jgi:hypothetical protein
MALTSTTLAAAITATATRVSLTSATGVVAGSVLKIDDEYCVVTRISGVWADVIRGVNGSKTAAHALLTPVIHTTNAAEWNPPMPAPRTYSYSADGAITIAPGLHLITKATAAAMTLADPPVDRAGIVLTIASATAAAHTVTMATSPLGGTETVYTFANVVGHTKTLVSTGAGKWAEVNTSRKADETAGVAVADP